MTPIHTAAAPEGQSLLRGEAVDESYALYFTDGGSVGLDLSAALGTLEVTWISVSTGVVT